MENKASGSKTRNTVYVAGLADEVNEQQLLDAFVTFGKSPLLVPSSDYITDTAGDIIEIKLPVDPQNQGKHRGFAFLTFTNPDDAADAIDNYDLNELPGYAGRGKFLKCSVANINKFAAADSGGDQKFDRPSKSFARAGVDMANEQFGNQRNGYRSTRRKVDRKGKRMERRHHSRRGNSRELCNVVSITALYDGFCEYVWNARIREA